MLVTGASGFVASHIIKQLLEDGQYRVRGTIRSLANEERADAIRKLVDNPKFELELVEADLLKEDSWKKYEIEFYALRILFATIETATYVSSQRA